MIRWTETPVHFVDFEGNQGSGILEYGVATVLGGEIVATTTRLCRAKGKIRAEDAAVHGIHEDDTSSLAPFHDDWEVFASLRSRGPFAAHFSATENSLIRATWPYARMSPDFSRPGGSTAEWGPWIDTGRLLPECLKGLRSARLEKLVGDCAIQAELDALAERHCPTRRARFHAALYDAIAAALLLISLGRRPEFSDITLPWLMAHSVMNPDGREDIQQGRLF